MYEVRLTPANGGAEVVDERGQVIAQIAPITAGAIIDSGQVDEGEREVQVRYKDGRMAVHDLSTGRMIRWT